MLLFLVLVVVPVVFCMVSWVLFTASRLYRPENTAELERRAFRQRARARVVSEPVPIGSQTISDDSRYLAIKQGHVYSMRQDRSTGIPFFWHDDIWLRRN